MRWRGGDQREICQRFLTAGAVVLGQIIDDGFGVVGGDRRAKDVGHLVDFGLPRLAVYEGRVGARVVETVTRRTVVLDEIVAGSVLERDRLFAGVRRSALEERHHGGEKIAGIWVADCRGPIYRGGRTYAFFYPMLTTSHIPTVSVSYFAEGGRIGPPSRECLS